MIKTTYVFFFSYMNCNLNKYMEKHKIKSDSKAFHLVSYFLITAEPCEGGQHTSQSHDFFHNAYTHLVNKTLGSDKKIILCAFHIYYRAK